MGNTVIFKPPKLGVLLHRPLLEAFQSAFPLFCRMQNLMWRLRSAFWEPSHSTVSAVRPCDSRYKSIEEPLGYVTDSEYGQQIDTNCLILASLCLRQR
ncbi:hypothetical protein [Desulfobacter postgatei]|jgi:hypothetical protein|uniref:hypothetical protein n=1 Tax=Desulfobacter postgatei TaxID=2293 RepID=UPI000232C139|nr:hypothetical protein [Desulfobacter postgatei]